MRPLAIVVVMVGVVLLALGTWLILRASLGRDGSARVPPRAPRPAPRPAPDPAPGPADEIADRPRAAVAFPPAAVARSVARPADDAAWRRPSPAVPAEPTTSGASGAVEAEPAVEAPIVAGATAAVTDPAVTDPAVTDPAITDPAITDPAITDPAITDPAVAEAPVAQPVPTATEESAAGDVTERAPADAVEAPDRQARIVELGGATAADRTADRTPDQQAPSADQTAPVAAPTLAGGTAADEPAEAEAGGGAAADRVADREQPVDAAGRPDGEQAPVAEATLAGASAAGAEPPVGEAGRPDGEQAPVAEPTLGGATAAGEEPPGGDAGAAGPGANREPGAAVEVGPLDLPAGAAAWGAPVVEPSADQEPAEDRAERVGDAAARGPRPPEDVPRPAAGGPRRPPEDVPRPAPRSSFAESLAARAEEAHDRPEDTRSAQPPVPRGDTVMPMGTVLGGSGYPPLPPPQAPLPPPAAPPAEQPADGPAPDPFADWAREHPGSQGHQLDPVVDQQGPLPDLGAAPAPRPAEEQPRPAEPAEEQPRPAEPAEDDWAARFGELAQQLGSPLGPDEPPGPVEPGPGPRADRPWPSRQGFRPDEPPAEPRPPQRPGAGTRGGDRPAGGGQPARGDRPQGPAGGDQPWTGGQPQGPRGGSQPWNRGGDRPPADHEPFGRPYGQEPSGPQRGPAAGPERAGRADTPRAAARQAGTRSRRGRPEDPRQAAVYDALAINEQVLDEVWTSPTVDVLKVVSSIVVNALDAYEDDPAEYADWVAVHRTGNCDCH
jgi:hypothetical protein